MNMWAFLALIIIVPVIVEYFKTKEKNRQQLSSTHDDLKQVKDHLKSIENRLENLETIAATDPEEFKASGEYYNETMNSMGEEEFSLKNNLDDSEKNRKKVSELARRKQQG